MKSYTDDDLKFCFLLPIEDSDEEEVKTKLVKCENCQMMIKECEMKNHVNTHNLSKPYQCEAKGCFKKFNTEENLFLHKKYFHNSKDESNINKNLSLNQRKIIALKNKMKEISFINSDIFNIEEQKEEQKDNEIKEEYAIGKYIYEDDKGNIINEKMFLSIEKEKANKDINDNNKKGDNNNRIILGYLSNGLHKI